MSESNGKNKSNNKSNNKSFLISKQLGFSSNTTLQLTPDTLRVS
jgi:hypothetical protein